MRCVAEGALPSLRTLDIRFFDLAPADLDHLKTALQKGALRQLEVECGGFQ
jgi:hypothetical protein